MNGKSKTLFFVVLSLGCSLASTETEQQRALDGTGVAAPPRTEDPSEEEPGEGPGCEVVPPQSIDTWATYENGHYAFQAPRELFLSLLGRTARVELTKEVKDNTDPAVSKYFAETVVQQNEPFLGAYYFIIRAGETAAPGSPATRLAELAALPQGLPPADRTFNVCGVVEAKETTYGCRPAVDAVIGCNTLRGYSYLWSRFVYDEKRVVELSCYGSGIVFDKEAQCAKVLDSLVVSE